MLHLRAFGSVRLIRDGGVPLEGIASQRRMLALLSILAVAGEDGVSRERIISLLWPENDSDRGRSSLSQCLYTARRLLRCDAIFRVSGDVLALNAGEITSDVSDFLGAMDAGRREEAACHFTGDFLDDFHVPGLTEFDQWLEAQRARFRNAADALFESLASAAEENAEWERAIEWRHRQSSIAPYNGRAAHRLANALRNGGNRAAALAQLRTHAALLRADLEMDPDASVVALMEELRTSPPTSGRAEEIENGVVDLPREKPPVVAVRAERRPKWHRWAVAGALNTALAAAAGGVILYGHGSSPPRQDTIVAPFRLSGADSSLRFLRDGLVEMVASRLDATGFGSLDPVIVRDAWRREGITGVSERSNRELWQVAGRVGAKRVLIGNVIGDQRHVIISTTVLDAGTEKALGVASVEGPLDSLSAMVDQLAGHLLLIDAGQVNRFSGRALPRLPALRAYLKGQAAYRIGAYLTALHDYERSLDADSNFALAALHLALTADRLDAFEQHERALTIAWSNRAQLATADRRRLVAFAGPG